MTGELDVTVPVRVPRSLYRVWSLAAQRSGASVAGVVLELARRGMTVGPQHRRRRDPSPARPWTPEEDSILQAMHAASASGPEIARYLGRPNSSVSQRRKQLHLTPHYVGRPRKAVA